MGESLASMPQWWVFKRIYQNNLNDYFKLLVESGIYSIAIKNENYKSTLKRRKGTCLVIMEEDGTRNFKSNVQTVKLNGSIQTIFQIWSVLVLLSVFVISIEIGKSRFVRCCYFLKNSIEISFTWISKSLSNRQILWSFHNTRKILTLHNLLTLSCRNESCSL